jgi:hypothetical protein
VPGKLIKTSMARSLRKNTLYISHAKRKQILNVVTKFLKLPYAPTETREYCRLIIKFDDITCEEILAIQTHDAKSEIFKSYLLKKFTCIHTLKIS